MWCDMEAEEQLDIVPVDECVRFRSNLVYVLLNSQENDKHIVHKENSIDDWINSKVDNKKIQIKKKNARTKEAILSWQNNRH